MKKFALIMAIISILLSIFALIFRRGWSRNLSACHGRLLASRQQLWSFIMKPEINWPAFWLNFIEGFQAFAAVLFFAAWLAILPSVGALYIAGLLP